MTSEGRDEEVSKYFSYAGKDGCGDIHACDIRETILWTDIFECPCESCKEPNKECAKEDGCSRSFEKIQSLIPGIPVNVIGIWKLVFGKFGDKGVASFPIEEVLQDKAC